MVTSVHVVPYISNPQGLQKNSSPTQLLTLGRVLLPVHSSVCLRVEDVQVLVWGTLKGQVHLKEHRSHEFFTFAVLVCTFKVLHSQCSGISRLERTGAWSPVYANFPVNYKSLFAPF